MLHRIAYNYFITILFAVLRKENEKLNVWVSLLNLENMYGTDVTMEETLRRAMQENDQRKVLKHLVNIYTQAGKLDVSSDWLCWMVTA